MLYQCKTSYFCCGVITDKHNWIIETAPILQWCVGMHINALKNWLDTKNGSIVECQENF